MVSQTLNKVILAEKQATEKVDLANKKAEQIIFEANETAKGLITKAHQDSKLETDQIVRKINIEINKISEDSIKNSLIESNEIRAKANENKEKAIDIVIKEIISKQ